MIRVLVVDDHPVLRAGLEAVLRAEPGFVCVGVAGDGAEMARAIHRTRPDVVVLDRRLGDEDGLRLCRELRSEQGAPQVVIYTAEPGAGLDSLAREAGACGVVEKATAIDALFNALRLAVRAGAPAAGQSAVA
jgi:DNA-binding NarL/FixJ family response regulator